MAAKIKKVAAKAKRVTTPQSGKQESLKGASNKAKDKSVELEVVPELMSPEVLKHLTKVEDFVANSNHMKEAELARGINAYSKQAASFALEAVKAGSNALVFAWACGKLLNTAKKKFGRGEFGIWRAANLDTGIIGERTAQRYMKLAKDCEDIRALLEWSPTLRQAYIACGILPQSSERESNDGEDADDMKRQALLSSITGIQKKLRLFTALKGRLGAVEKNQLKLAKMEIDEFFDQILA